MVFGIFRKRFFRKLRMSEREGSGSDVGSMDDNYEVEEIRAKMRGDDGEYLYYVKVGSHNILSKDFKFLLNFSCSGLAGILTPTLGNQKSISTSAQRSWRTLRGNGEESRRRRGIGKERTRRGRDERDGRES